MLGYIQHQNQILTYKLKNKNMKTLVIHPRDYTTRFLKLVYQDHPEWTVLEDSVSNSELKNQIKNHDRIVMLGHGTGYGLLGWNKFVIDSTLVYLLREKVLFAVWCNCDIFFKRYDLKGFFTGMIISELQEAYMCDVESTEEEVEEYNWLFAEALQKSINEPNILETAKSIYIGDNPLVEFNQNRMYFAE